MRDRQTDKYYRRRRADHQKSVQGSIIGLCDKITIVAVKELEFGDGAFSVLEPKEWTSPPVEVRRCTSVVQLK